MSVVFVIIYSVAGGFVKIQCASDTLNKSGQICLLLCLFSEGKHDKIVQKPALLCISGAAVW